MILIAKERFQFYTRQNLTFLSNKRASNLLELLSGIKDAPDMSIYHHTHHYLEQHEYLSPEPPNDFAYWVTNILKDSSLGEEIANVDLRRYPTINEIRQNIIEIIALSVNQSNETLSRKVPAGAEFHFMSARMFVFPTKYIANNLAEFGECLKKVSINSIFYHVFETKLFGKIPGICNWLSSSLNEKDLSEEIGKLNPYSNTMEDLRKMIIGMVESKLRGYSNGQA